MISRSSNNLIAYLLDRPVALAHRAAREGDDQLLEGRLFAAQRCAPGDPLIDRRPLKSTTNALDNLRACRAPQVAMALASHALAVLDPAVLRRPGAFRPDRSWQEYLHWGLWPAPWRRGLAEPGGVAGDAQAAAGPARTGAGQQRQPGRIDRADTP